MFQQILTIDKDITIWIYHSVPRFFLFDWISQLVNIILVPIIIWTIILVIFHYQKRRYFILLPLFNLIVTGGITNYILKNVFMRIRPCIQDIVLNFLCPTDFSFPSSHAATSFAAATAISLLDPKRRILYYSVALFISLSRIYLGVHYLFDVIGGIVLGVTISLLSMKLIHHKRSHNMKNKPDHESCTKSYLS